MRSRKLFVALVSLLIVSVFQTACFPPPKPVGEWIVSGSPDAIVFRKDGTFETLHYDYDHYPPPPNAPGYSEGSQIPGSGKWRVRDVGTYTVDFSKEPAWIDMIITKQGAAPRRQEGLIRFLDDNTFYMAVDDARPASIDDFSRKIRCTKAAPNEINR